MHIPFNEKKWTKLNKEIPINQRAMSIGDEFEHLICESNPFWLERNKPVGKGRYTQIEQFAKFKCECGNTKDLRCYVVKSNRTISCGCIARKIQLQRMQKGTFAKNGLKKCSICFKIKTIQNFHKSKKAKDKLTTLCSECAYFKHINIKYKLNKKDYENYLNRQNWACALCGETDFQKKRPCVDHCHITNKVRGLLCDRCNRGIGAFNDNITLLQKAITYLKRSI